MTSHPAGYHGQMEISLCKYGCPIDITDSGNMECQSVRNHNGTREFPDQMNVSPLNTREKRDCDERRVIMDLSFSPVNDKILKDSNLGESTSLRYPSVDALMQMVREKGPGYALMKCDVKRAYRQIQVDSRDWTFLGKKWQGTCVLIWKCQWVWGR